MGVGGSGLGSGLGGMEVYVAGLAGFPLDRLRCFLHLRQPKRVSKVEHCVKHRLNIVASSVDWAATPMDVFA